MFLTQKLRFSGLLGFWIYPFVGFQKHKKNAHSMPAAGFVYIFGIRKVEKHIFRWVY